MVALMLLKVVDEKEKEGGSAGAGSVARLEGIVAELGGEGAQVFQPHICIANPFPPIKTTSLSPYCIMLLKYR